MIVIKSDRWNEYYLEVDPNPMFQCLSSKSIILWKG